MRRVDTLCVELTAKCPLHCVHCSASASPQRDEVLPLEKFQETVRQWGRLREIYLSGGEPFEHPNLAGFVRASRPHAAATIVYSSGVRIGVSGIEPLRSNEVARLAELGVARVDVSLYAASAIEHDAVTRVSGSFESTLRSLAVLRSQGLAFGIHFVPIASEGESVVRVAALARDLGATRLHILAVVPQGRAHHLNPKLSDAFLTKVRHMTAVSGLEFLRSRSIRSALGEPPTERDSWDAAFLGVDGHLYESEGAQYVRRLVPQAAAPQDMARELMSLN